MSAWVVEKEHIDVLIAFGLSDPRDRLTWYVDPAQPWDGENVGRLEYENATEVGRMLMEENVASVCYRYSDDTADMYEDALTYTYRDPHYVLTPGEALKAIGCLSYQSCEHPGWEESEAKRMLDALEAKAVGMLYEGPWGWGNDELAAKPRTVRVI